MDKYVLDLTINFIIKMNKIFTLLLIPMIIGCESTVSNDTPENFGESLFLSLRKNDFRTAEKLLLVHSDSSFFTNENTRSDMQFLLSDRNYDFFIDNFKNNFSILYSEGERIGVNWRKSTFHSIDFVKLYDEDQKIEYMKQLSIYFKDNLRRYKIDVDEVYMVGNQWKNFNLNKIVDVDRENERLKGSPYVPFGMNFDIYYKYLIDETDNRKFKAFIANLNNKSEYDFDYVKYKISITTRISGFTSEIFSRTYEMEDKVFSGDIIQIEIKELENLSTGVDLRDRNNFRFSGQILDSKPNPELIKDF